MTPFPERMEEMDNGSFERAVVVGRGIEQLMDYQRNGRLFPKDRPILGRVQSTKTGLRRCLGYTG